MVDDLKEYIDREPFVSFRIILTSGNTYEVSSPYQIAIGQTQLGYYFPKSHRKATLRLNQIAALEDSEHAQP